ncbi:hypothetical protein [Cellulosimicrobium funkei]
MTPQPTNHTGPVVALDVDGTINAIPADPAGPSAPGLVEHRVTLHADHWPAGKATDPPSASRTPFLRPLPSETLETTVHVPEGVGSWILNLLDNGVEVVWATTWEHAANTYIASLLAIPALPVATVWADNRTRPTFGEVKDRDSATWKARTLKNTYPARSVVWLDDQAHRWAGRRTASWLPEPSLVVTPDPTTGATQDVRNLVDAWLAQQS